MSAETTAQLVEADRRHGWHPFTQMRDWCAPDHEPLFLESGRGALLRDTRGREYLDGNSSIWTNLHGHRHPRIDAALREQLDCVAHTSFLGFANPPAARLARELSALFPPDTLTRVFFSDDGSTAIEVAIKMAAQFWQLNGQPARRQFAAFTCAYHGDTMGASSLGGVPLFHERFAAWQFPVRHVATLEELAQIDSPGELAAVVIEPLIQGVNRMRPWPAGMLARLRAWCDAHGVLLIADEIMTGFGRTGTMFACEQEGVIPDFLALAKGLTGGYLPLAATLTTERIFQAFLGSVAEQKSFSYGHSYTANQLGCAAALANLEIFRTESVLEKLQPKIALLREQLASLASEPHVGEIRQLGFIAGIDVVAGPGRAFEPHRQIGAAVCLAARRYGLLTRPIGDTIVVMPPYCISDYQLRQLVEAIRLALRETCPPAASAGD